MTYENKAYLRLSDSVLQVWRKRDDFVATVMEGHRQLVAKQAGVDPFASACRMQAGIERDITNVQGKEARLQMIQALLHVWYRVKPDIQSAIMQGVREAAILNNEDVNMALFSTQQILNQARGAGQAMSELHAANNAAEVSRAQKRDQLDRKRVLEHFNR